MSVILTCNAGSTNIKFAIFDAQTLERTGHALTYSPSDSTAWLCSMGTKGLSAIGYRVVHGGQEFIQPVMITDDIIDKLRAYITLAPLHQPAVLSLVAEARKLYPTLPHIACFDTAFHQTMTEAERRFPLPRRFHDKGIMRYGFHGLSYQHIADILPEFAGEKAKGRIIVAHLGGGSSACAMKNFQSVATTMGFSTLDGMMMDTRCGALDPGVILYLLTEKKMSATEVSDLLYYESGLKGVSGISGNMEELLESKSATAQEAVVLYCTLAAKQIAALVPTLGGLDAIVFTGGIGEHATLVRDRIVELLRWIGYFPVYVIAADEEIVIAKACQKISRALM